MPNITVKNIPESIYQKLKEQAEANHRSINSQIIANLEQALTPNRVSSEEVLSQARKLRERIKGRLSNEEIREAIKSGRP